MTEIQEFINKLLNKDNRAWEQFIEKYSKLIYYFCSSKCRYETDDAYMYVMEQIIKNDFHILRQFKGTTQTSFKAYLKQVATNRAIDFLRSRKKENNIIPEEITDYDQNIISDIFNPEEDYNKSELNEILNEAIMQLELSLREIVFYRLKGETYKTIGEILGITDRSVEGRFDKAKKLLCENKKLRDLFYGSRL